ncbi:MAG: KH domain-containing protein [Clostridia bacterium]|nr:KH domain-containing protein [Clostridia bacterium]
MGLEVEVTAELKEDIVEVNLEGDNMGVVIGKRGDTLDSLQYLTSLVVNQKSEDYIKISIDTENYREKREEVLCALANRLAAKVARTGKKFALEPMNPYERRIIHSNLQDNEDVTTFSIGQEPYRKVVIAPKNPKPYNKRSGYKKSETKPAADSTVADDAEETASSTVTYKADFKPQQHKAEYKNFEEYLAAHSKD